jgi:hypothetical protein
MTMTDRQATLLQKSGNPKPAGAEQYCEMRLWKRRRPQLERRLFASSNGFI